MSDRLVPVDDIVTVDVIAERLGWSLNRTVNVVQGRDGRFKQKFPRPLTGTAKRGAWLWTDVLAWLETETPGMVALRRAAARDDSSPQRRPEPFS